MNIYYSSRIVLLTYYLSKLIVINCIKNPVKSSDFAIGVDANYVW
jgi:hypothetical protein